MSPDRIEVSSVVISPTIEIPRDKRGRIRWASLRNDPQLLVSTLEAEVGQFIAQGNKLSQANLNTAGLSGLVSAIRQYYPDGIKQLKTNLGLQLNKPNGYWTPEQMREDALVFYKDEGVLSRPFLRQKGRGDLEVAVAKSYPGGITQIQIDIGLKPNRKDKYWTPETVEQEARGFVRQNGTINQRLLNKQSKFDLGSAIDSHYPGKLSGLKETLGIKSYKPRGYWTIENIESEARQLVEQEITISPSTIYQAGLASLVKATYRYYPGGMAGLKAKLGIGVQNEEEISADQANEELSKLLEGEI